MDGSVEIILKLRVPNTLNIPLKIATVIGTIFRLSGKDYEGI